MTHDARLRPCDVPVLWDEERSVPMPDGLTQVLGVASLSEVPPARLHEVMEL